MLCDAAAKSGADVQSCIPVDQERPPDPVTPVWIIRQHSRRDPGNLGGQRRPRNPATLRRRTRRGLRASPPRPEPHHARTDSPRPVVRSRQTSGATPTPSGNSSPAWTATRPTDGPLRTNASPSRNPRSVRHLTLVPLGRSTALPTSSSPACLTRPGETSAGHRIL